MPDFDALTKNERTIAEAVVSNELASRINNSFPTPRTSNYVDGVEIIWECPYMAPKGTLTVNRNFGRPLTNPSLLSEKAVLEQEVAAAKKRLAPAQKDLEESQAEYDRIAEAQKESNKKGEAITEAVMDNLLAAKSNVENSKAAIASIEASTRQFADRLAVVESQLPEIKPIQDLIVIEVELA